MAHFALLNRSFQGLCRLSRSALNTTNQCMFSSVPGPKLCSSSSGAAAAVMRTANDATRPFPTISSQHLPLSIRLFLDSPNGIPLTQISDPVVESSSNGLLARTYWGRWISTKKRKKIKMNKHKREKREKFAKKVQA
eukprot:TRINITY_DN257_c0_g1::TRINITY_DN257_c0_g1_i1::g.1588::m.1588 TRINITY_DN257_c0_g1::TRINITY_DN257_c0_g1_i1::g.1588  ORF type:complete len:151 (+),score=5.28,DUF1713/PF08213.6/0.73 TRINITY_DN257_c0_g1_i1:43-453(+)